MSKTPQRNKNNSLQRSKNLSQRIRQNEPVKNVDIEELINTMPHRICSTDILKLLDNALRDLPDTDASHDKRRKLAEAVLKALRTAKLSTSRADEIVNRLSVDFPAYPKQQLVKMVEFSIDSLCANNDPYQSWKDTIPILLQALEEEKYLQHVNQEVSGMEYKSIIVNNICNSHWDLEIITSLAKMFGDMCLEKNELEVVMSTLCRKMTTMELNELPPFIHQTLRLCGNHDCRQLLENLRKYFAQRYLEAAPNDEDSPEEIAAVSQKEVQDAESTVLYHIYQAAQLNYKSIRNFIRMLKNLGAAPEYILEPFMMSVLLLLSNVYDEQVFDVLKQAISRSLQDEEKCKNSAWLRKRMPTEQNVTKVLENVIANSNANRHMVLKGLVELSFVLLGIESSSLKVRNDENAFWKIGSMILRTVMTKRHEIGATVLKTLVDRIVGGGLNIHQYTECLTFMCRKLTIVVLDCHTSIATLLDQLSNIPGESAELIFYAILPLIRISANVRDNLVLALRKALHRKGTQKRRMAVTGFLEMLKNFNTRSVTGPTLSQSSSSLSQPSSSTNTSVLTQVMLERNSQETRNLSSNNKSLCHDILGILRKCFTHEYDVKLRLYNGLFDVVLKNPEIAEYVLEMLHAHLNGYYESDENALPPLRFDLCTDVQGPTAIPQEPLAELVSVICKIYVKVAQKSSSTVDKIAETLESICQRMVRMELEHLNVDEKMNLHDNVAKSQQKLETVKLTVMVYEALMAFRIESWSEDNPDSAQNVYKLYKPYKRFIDFTKRHSKTKKVDGKNKKEKDKEASNVSMKKPNRSYNFKINTVMDLDTVCKVLEMLYLDSTSDETTSTRSHNEFHHYILQTCSQLLQGAKNLSDHELKQYRARYVKSIIKIGRLLYKNPICDLIDTHHADPQRAILALECFKAICSLMCTSLSSDLFKFLDTILDDVDANCQGSHLQALISSIKSLLRSFLDGAFDDDTDSKKVLQLLLETLQQLVHKIDFQEVNGEKVQKWLLMFTQFPDIESSLALTVLQLVLWIDERCNENGEILNDICMELNRVLPMIDSTEMTVKESFKIITEEIAAQVYNLVNNCIREKLNNAVWLLARIKAEQGVTCVPGMDDEDYRGGVKNKERSLCKQLSYILQMLCNLASMKIDPGPSTDNIFKNLQSLYNLLSSLTKYFCSKSTVQNPAFQAVKFIQVIQLAGKELKSIFYNLIVHTEECQNKDNTTSKADKNAQRNKVLKETRIIPRVVYEIEQFKKEIMLLEKKTGVPLEPYISHSMTRDFRINNSQLEEGLEGMNTTLFSTQSSHITQSSTRRSAEDTTLNSSSENHDISSPSKKRQKTSSQG